MDYDINTAIDAYSHSMGNRREALAEFCGTRGLVDRETEIRAAIDKIQGDIFDLISRMARERGPLSADEIEKVTVGHCGRHYPDVNESGVRGLLRWIVWMAWHEGCMQ